MFTAEIKNRQFSFQNKPLRLHGIGLGSWLNLEHFMVGLPGLDRMIRDALDQRYPGTVSEFENHFFTAEDAEYLAGIGVNFLRVPFRSSLLWDEQRNAICPEGLNVLVRLADLCEAHHLFFMPDLHAVPGAQNPDWHSGCETGVPLFWKYQAFRDAAVRVWETVAEALSGYQYLFGYDLLNEPVLPSSDKEVLNDFHSRASEGIRRHDSSHLILVEGSRFAMDFSGVRLPDPGRSAYTFHYYPGVWDARLEDPGFPPAEREVAYQSAFDAIHRSMSAYNGPMLCGEAGVELQTLGEETGVRLLSEQLSVFEKEDVNWCLWSYKDTGMMGLRIPSPKTPWMKLADLIRTKWDHHRDMHLGQDFATRMAQAWVSDLTEEEKNTLQFQLRATMFSPETEHWLKPALKQLTEEEAACLGKSFAFSNTEERTLYRRLLQQACRQSYP